MVWSRKAISISCEVMGWSEGPEIVNFVRSSGTEWRKKWSSVSLDTTLGSEIRSLSINRVVTATLDFEVSFLQADCRLEALPFSRSRLKLRVLIDSSSLTRD